MIIWPVQTLLTVRFVFFFDYHLFFQCRILFPLHQPFYIELQNKRV